MGWQSEVLFFLLMRYVATTRSHQINLPDNFLEEDIHQNLDAIGKEEGLRPINLYEDIKLERLGRILANVLVQPWPKGVSPIVYVENNGIHPPEETPLENDVAEKVSNMPLKRSRYYRKYPWKRQNSRYEPENRYLCEPTKEDVFRLLVALHEARQGNRGQFVNFCNRRRPASAIFTNIRFLG